MIRLVYGSEEVLEKKQDANAKEKSFKTGPVNKVVDGVRYYETSIDDPAVIAFLKKTSYWEDGRVAVYDPLAESKKQADALIRDTQILGKVAQIKENSDLAKYGYYLFGQEALTQAAAGDYSSLQVKLFLYAQENPEKMEALMDSKNNKSSEYLEAGLAFAKGIIKEADSGTAVVWGDTEVKILTVVVGQKPLDATVEFFGTTEGKEVKQLVFNKIEEITKEALAKETAAAKPATKPATGAAK